MRKDENGVVDEKWKKERIVKRRRKGFAEGMIGSLGRVIEGMILRKEEG